MERKDVWSDLLNEEEAHRKLSIGIFDIWALGLTIVIGGQYFSWNNGLSSGFGSFTLSTFLIGTAYICLCLCNAEISSSLPFAGGAYGLARVIFGLFPGFLIGCCEAVEYIVYVAASVITLCDMIASITRSTEEIALLYILLFYISALFIHIKGGPLFWRSNTVLAILSLLLLLIFCLGALPWANLAANGPAESTSGSSGSEWFVGGFPMFVRAMPQAAWFYVGVESLNLGIGFVEEPRRVLPRGSMLCVLTLFFTSMFVLFVSASLPPLQEGDVLAKQLTPFNNGYLRMFRGISYDMATMLSIPATYATAFGFIFSFGRVILSMARSRLLPPIFARTYGDYKTPYAAMIGGSLLGFSLCVIAFLVPTIRKQLFNWCFLPALCTYICQCIGYIIYKIQYPNQERLFVSPLGIYGAIYSATVFAFAAISEAGFQKDNFVGLILFLGSIALYAVYYFSYARMKQVFSAEEKFVYMKLIVKCKWCCYLTPFFLTPCCFIQLSLSLSTTRLPV
jgi:amino acid transporter